MVLIDSQLCQRLFSESAKLHQVVHLPFKTCAQIAAYAQLNRRVPLMKFELDELSAATK
jgi:hypothetical protein